MVTHNVMLILEFRYCLGSEVHDPYGTRVRPKSKMTFVPVESELTDTSQFFLHNTGKWTHVLHFIFTIITWDCVNSFERIIIRLNQLWCVQLEFQNL